MNAVIHYFTGTGNTARVAELLRQALAEKGVAVSVLPAVPAGDGARTQPAPVAGGQGHADLHVMAFPVYAFAMPQAMRRYVCSLPRGGGARAAAVAVVGETKARRGSGGYEGQALVQARRLLRRRGFDVVLTDVVSHVLNFTQFVNPPPPQVQQGIDDLARRHATDIAARLVVGGTSLRPCGWFNRAWSGAVAWSFMLIGRRAMGKLFVADGRCNACGLCRRACPVGAIGNIFGRPRWRLNCQACQRCINICPTRAIQTSAVRVVAMLALFAVPYHRLLWPLVPAGWFGGRVFLTIAAKIVLWIAGYFAANIVADKILYWLEFVPGLRAVLGWGFTRRFRRYVEPGLLGRWAQPRQ